MFNNALQPPYPLETLWQWRERKREAFANGLNEEQWGEQERPYLDAMRSERYEIAATLGIEWWEVNESHMCDKRGGMSTCSVTDLLNDGLSCGMCGRAKLKRVPVNEFMTLSEYQRWEENN